MKWIFRSTCVLVFDGSFLFVIAERPDGHDSVFDSDAGESEESALVKRRRRIGWLSTINEETSSVLTKMSRNSSGMLDNIYLQNTTTLPLKPSNKRVNNFLIFFSTL